MASSVSVTVPSYGYTYTFSGVISVQHEFSLKLQTDSESATGTDYINGARNQPDKIILMEDRALCRLHFFCTPLSAYIDEKIWKYIS